MRLLLLALVCLAAGCGGADKAADSAAAIAPAPGTPPPAPIATAITERGFAPLQAGMTLTEASAALNGALVVPVGGDTSACGYARWTNGPAGVRVMTEAGRIARVDVDSGTVATAAGARIGDSEQRIDSLYAGRLASTPHKYTTGRYLTVTPAAPADSAYRIVFETDGKRVTKYRAGRRPAVEMVEGCG